MKFKIGDIVRFNLPIIYGKDVYRITEVRKGGRYVIKSIKYQKTLGHLVFDAQIELCEEPNDILKEIL